MQYKFYTERDGVSHKRRVSFREKSIQTMGIRPSLALLEVDSEAGKVCEFHV